VSATRGRPRLAETDAAILRSTLELLANEGLRGLSVEGVAARAGVAKTTVYRRFATKDELVAAALETLALVAPPDLDTGTVLGDMGALARSRVAADPEVRWSLLMPRLVVESADDPALHELVHRILVRPERAVIAAILRRGVERGELPADLDLEFAVDVVLGPAVYRVLIGRGELAGLPELIERALGLLAR
jgi:AcrR family transcriptional regulator